MADNIQVPKSNKGIIIAIVVVTFIFLIAIGVAVYFFFGNKLFGPPSPPSPSGGTGATGSRGGTGGTGGGAGGTGATGSRGGTGGTGGITPSNPTGEPIPTYLYIQQYAITPYPSYLSVRTIESKMYLVPNYMATQENSLFYIDSSSGLVFKDMSDNKYKNIAVNRATKEMSLIDPSANPMNDPSQADRIYISQTSNSSIFQLRYANPTLNTASYLSIVQLTSGISYNVFGAVPLANVRNTFLKKEQLDPLKPLYFSLTKDTNLSPKYLSFEENLLRGSSLCYLNIDGRAIYNPDCQFYLDTSTFMLMKQTSANIYQYITRNNDPSNTTAPPTFTFTNDPMKENIKFIVPDILTYFLNDNSQYICTNLIQQLDKNVISDTLKVDSTTSCQLGEITQTPTPSPYVDIYTYNQDGGALYLRTQVIPNVFISKLFLMDPNQMNLSDKYYIKDQEGFITVFKEDKFKYIDLDEDGGNYTLAYKNLPSDKSIRLSPTSSSNNYYIINTYSGNKCLITKNRTTLGDYLGFKSTTGYDGSCITFGIDQK
jgi:hypothetical protein